MDQHEILKKIGVIITELKDQYTYLDAEENQLNELELELFMANAKFLSDHIEILKKISGQKIPAALPSPDSGQTYGQRQPVPDYFKEEQFSFVEEKLSESTENIEEAEIHGFTETSHPEEPVFKSVDQQPETESEETILLPEVMPDEEMEDVTAVSDASFTTQKSEPLEEYEASPEPASVLSEPELRPHMEAPVQPQVSFQPEIESASFNISGSAGTEKTGPEKEAVLTLNQRIAAQKESAKDVGKPFTEKKSIPDLQSLININDKLLFVKELFNGYNLAYAEAINILNRYTTFEQSEQFLNVNYATKNNWNEKPTTTARFFEILRKRFS